LIGQTVAGIASFAGVMLVWTGLALSLHRFIAWIRRAAGKPDPAVQGSTSSSVGAVGGAQARQRAASSYDRAFLDH
jgi:hypothetical protein